MLAPDPEGYLFHQESAQDERARLAASRYLGASPGEVALTDSTTMGLGVLYGGLQLSPGDEIVTTTQDFYSTHEALRLRALETGASCIEMSPRSPSTNSSPRYARASRPGRACSP